MKYCFECKHELTEVLLGIPASEMSVLINMSYEVHAWCLKETTLLPSVILFKDYKNKNAEIKESNKKVKEKNYFYYGQN